VCVRESVGETRPSEASLKIAASSSHKNSVDRLHDGATVFEIGEPLQRRSGVERREGTLEKH
jgi:hypothetical protein